MNIFLSNYVIDYTEEICFQLKVVAEVVHREGYKVGEKMDEKYIPRSRLNWTILHNLKNLFKQGMLEVCIFTLIFISYFVSFPY